MDENSLQTLVGYSRHLADVFDRPEVQHSTVAVWSDSPYTGTAEGEVLFRNGVPLRMREELDFAAGMITSYGYEIYRGQERLYWYDDFPHPHDPSLASTFPHHKHIPPDIKRHRIPAPNISYTQTNLPTIVNEILEIVADEVAE